MPDDPTPSDQLGGQARFRADLVAYLDSLSVNELGELLGELPSSRQEPLQLGVLMVALNERLPDSHKLLPPAGQPGPYEGRRRSLREVVADRRAARTTRHNGPPPQALGEWLAGRQRQAEQLTDRRRAGAVAERRVAEALRARSTDPDPAAGHQERGDPSAELPDWQGEERDNDREGDFGDSWRAYQGRADHIRQTYGWTVPELPPRAENWLPLGSDDDQERDSDREDRRLWVSVPQTSPARCRGLLLPMLGRRRRR